MNLSQKERRFLSALEALFVGAKVDGESGFVNLMRLKFTYFQSIRAILLDRIDNRAEQGTSFREELFDKLYTFFDRYFCESGSIYFRYLPAFSKSYEKLYEKGDDVSLAWKTHMLYYVKSDVLVHSMPVEIVSAHPPHTKRFFHFDASEIEHNKNNVKKEFVYRFHKIISKNNNRTVHFSVLYSVNGSKTKFDDIIKDVRKAQNGFVLPKEDLKNAIRIFQTQTEVDYFINKDSEKFLKEQFDLWMYQYLFGEETLFSADRVSQLKAIQDTAYDIIAFIAQFEDELRRIWEKPKFVRNTNYVLTLDKLSRQLIKKITTHSGFKNQVSEWLDLGLTDGELTADTLLSNDKLPIDNGLADEFLFLPLDTVHFNDIKCEILEELGDLDSVIDGELVCSDNWQALNSLCKRYAQKVDCIHIDPPYNTKSSGFLYKNEYRHSSWLTMMENRIAFVDKLLMKDGAFLCHIDEHEYERLHLLLEATDLLNAGTIVWDKRNPVSGRKGIATQHEYVIWRSKSEQFLSAESKNRRLILNKVNELIRVYGSVNEKVRSEFQKWIASNRNFSGGESAYRYIDDEGRVYCSVSLSAPEPRSDPKFHLPLLHPQTQMPCAVPPHGFSRTPETLRSMLDSGEILFGTDETAQPRQKRILDKGARTLISSVIQNAKSGKADLDKLGLNFPYCHPVDLYSDLIEPAINSNSGVVLDYFAGSGTTGHAVIEVNRSDNGNRKYLLVEMGDYFDSVLVPRIKKVVYSREWRRGKPVSSLGSSHAFKYYRLEQYEETLKNMRYKDSDQLELDSIKSPFEQYVFFGDDKFSQFVDLSDENSIKINLTDLYEDIDIAESLSNVLGKSIRKISSDEVLFADGSVEKINPNKMTESEKINFISLIKPYLWWGE